MTNENYLCNLIHAHGFFYYMKNKRPHKSEQHFIISTMDFRTINTIKQCQHNLRKMREYRCSQ